jgi:predicted PurR-regulated permease PerM
MRINALDLIQSFAVALPVFAMLLVAIATVFSQLKQFIRKRKPSHKSRRLAIVAVSVAMGLTFLPFAAIYRPGMVEVANAQIRQQDDVDEDESGDPENSPKQLDRQLRRIRRGEKVEALYLRQE